MAITSTELRAIQQAVADAFDDDASGELELTVSGIEIRDAKIVADAKYEQEVERARRG